MEKFMEGENFYIINVFIYIHGNFFFLRKTKQLGRYETLDERKFQKGE